MFILYSYSFIRPIVLKGIDLSMSYPYTTFYKRQTVITRAMADENSALLAAYKRHVAVYSTVYKRDRWPDVLWI